MSLSCSNIQPKVAHVCDKSYIALTKVGGGALLNLDWIGVRTAVTSKRESGIQIVY